ncbi:alpha/beta family hydrolase [Ruegeria sp. THAF57]|uniref:alpha/beta hydrolase family protein n=1 Tax=Ruegeria sp. THAF57 TaxID=2744555 RepID=UPI00351A4741
MSNVSFHTGKPQKLRTEHLQCLRTPTLICQGTRDQCGKKDEVSSYELSSATQMSWFEDGEHDLKPRKRVSGYTHAAHMNATGAEVATWIEGLNL